MMNAATEHLADNKSHLDRLIASIRQRLAFGQDRHEIASDLENEGHVAGEIYLAYVAALMLFNEGEANA